MTQFTITCSTIPAGESTLFVYQPSIRGGNSHQSFVAIEENLSGEITAWAIIVGEWELEGLAIAAKEFLRTPEKTRHAIPETGVVSCRVSEKVGKHHIFFKFYGGQDLMGFQVSDKYLHYSRGSSCWGGYPADEWSMEFYSRADALAIVEAFAQIDDYEAENLFKVPAAFGPHNWLLDEAPSKFFDFLLPLPDPNPSNNIRSKLFKNYPILYDIRSLAFDLNVFHTVERVECANECSNQFNRKKTEAWRTVCMPCYKSEVAAGKRRKPLPTVAQVSAAIRAREIHPAPTKPKKTKAPKVISC